MRRLLSKKRVVGILLMLALFGAGFFAASRLRTKAPEAPPVPLIEQPKGPVYKIIGTSVQGRSIEGYTYGNGATHLLFVGGMHGGYEWNSVLLAYQFMDYLSANPGVIPKSLSVSVIPSLNPDGVYAVTGKEGRFALRDVSTDKEVLARGRFNAHEVDLNRNFDCKWKPTSTWQTKTVSAGQAPFSEPETLALRSFVSAYKPSGVVFWHSQANAVYASECEHGILGATLDIMNAYASASGYSAAPSFDAYAVTGDSEGWLASIGIPSITVELQTHETVELDRNLRGIKALFEYYRQHP